MKHLINSQFTEFITELVDKIAKDMGLQHYREYYTLDHILYDKEDAIPEGLLRFGTILCMGHGLPIFAL